MVRYSTGRVDQFRPKLTIYHLRGTEWDDMTMNARRWEMDLEAPHDESGLRGSVPMSAPHGWFLQEICHGDWFTNWQTGPFPSREAAKQFAEAEQTRKRTLRRAQLSDLWEDGDDFSAASDGLLEWWVSPIDDPEAIQFFDKILELVHA